MALAPNRDARLSGSSTCWTAGRVVAPRLLPLQPSHEMAHDAGGNVVSTTASDGTVLTQAFDPAGRLESLTNGALQRRLSYTYTPSGLRSSMTVTNLGDGTQRTTGYAWGPDGLLSGVTPWTGDPITLTYNAGRRRTAVAFATGAFINGVDLDDRFAFVTASAACPVVADAVGSIRSLLDPAGTPLNSYSYTAYGLPRATDETLPFAYRFGGQPWDDETELAYVRARYLDPRSGRFISADPLRERDRYAYAGGNPAAAMDPTGLTIAPPQRGSLNGELTPALDILRESATDTFPSLEDANYSIGLSVSINAAPTEQDEEFSSGRTGCYLDTSWQDPAIREDYHKHIKNGQFAAGCSLPGEPLQCVSFHGTLVEHRRLGGRFLYTLKMRSAAWHALTLYHESLHALHYDWAYDKPPELAKTLHQRIETSERRFYWSLFDADLRSRNFRLFGEEWHYQVFGDAPYGPY